MQSNDRNLSPKGIEVHQAIQQNLRGQSPQAVIKNYTERAPTYDNYVSLGQYNGPQMAAEEVASRVPESQRSNVRIIDVAAGTGKVGLELKARGFTNIDALEPSEGMLEVLRKTGVYSKEYQEYLGIGENSVPGDSYDFLVTSGGMAQGLVPVKGIDDMIRITKPGGLLINVMREEVLHEVEEYKNRLVPHMDLMEQMGYWSKVEVKRVTNYGFGKDGIIFIYRVL